MVRCARASIHLKRCCVQSTAWVAVAVAVATHAAGPAEHARKHSRTAHAPRLDSSSFLGLLPTQPRTAKQGKGLGRAASSHLTRLFSLLLLLCWGADDVCTMLVSRIVAVPRAGLQRGRLDWLVAGRRFPRSFGFGIEGAGLPACWPGLPSLASSCPRCLPAAGPAPRPFDLPVVIKRQATQCSNVPAKWFGWQTDAAQQRSRSSTRLVSSRPVLDPPPTRCRSFTSASLLCRFTILPICASPLSLSPSTTRTAPFRPPLQGSIPIPWLLWPLTQTRFVHRPPRGLRRLGTAPHAPLHRLSGAFLKLAIALADHLALAPASIVSSTNNDNTAAAASLP
ncbi:uncharacterized protein PSFLO_02725 [Pseudozyma flocculosa]|uniref:Uncharacterized protein n=1 Tax=Pseudozyma flocculosa TaxID=84751 RepID=A0A5C3EYB2_9BASI|nr:uncharacterized protein PSFLO_02725 [Pseudozyma flocculosa]